MKNDNVIEHVGADEIAKDVQKRIKNVGVRGLSIEKAKELGVYDRISKLLTAYHATMMAGYRIYGNAYALLSSFGGAKNEIAKSCNQLDRAYEKFISFWTMYYSNTYGNNEMGRESEKLYHNIMRWAQLPLAWNLGDKQRTDETTDVVIVIEDEDEERNINITTSVTNEETNVIKESWCVTKFNAQTLCQECVETGLDKATALMVAKRMSDNDKESVYTASQLLDVEKKETIVTPFRAFQANNQVGRSKNVLKK